MLINWLNKTNVELTDETPLWVREIKAYLAELGGLQALNKKFKVLRQGGSIPIVIHIMLAFSEMHSWNDTEEWCWDNITLNNHNRKQSRLFRKGYFCVGQFLDGDGRTLPPDRNTLTGVETLEWYAITGAIQRKYRGRNINIMNDNATILGPGILINKTRLELKDINLRSVKNALRNPDRPKSKGQQKLEAMFGFQICQTTAKKIIWNQSEVPRIRSYWFKFFNSITRANVHYEQFGIIDDPKCTWCDVTPQTREHLYILCPTVRDFISDITRAADITQHYERWLNGALDRAAAWVMGETVYFVHASNYRRREINRVTFLAWLGKKRDIELKIANDNLRFERYDKKWSNITSELNLPF